MSRQLIINGITFNVEACLALGKARFLEEVGAVHFADNKPAERRRMLLKVWKMIGGED